MTERQAAGLARMESYAGIRSSRTEFADRDAFSAYWDLVSRRCDGATRARNAETPASREERAKRRAERVLAYYQDAGHLQAYARQYVARYQPSAAKLRQQLLAKAGGDEELCGQVMLSVAGCLDDDARARDVAEALQRQGRHAQAIRGKLRQRLFTADAIERCLQAMTAATGSVLEVATVARKARQLQRKGISQRAMRGKLMGSAADGDVVRAGLGEALGDGGDDVALRSAIARLARKDLERRALVQRLMGKGFRYADIVRILAEASPAE